MAGRLQRLLVSARVGRIVSAYRRIDVSARRALDGKTRRYPDTPTRRHDLILAVRRPVLYPFAHVGLRSGPCNNF